LGYEVKALTGINIDTKQRDNVIEQLFNIDGVREVAEVTGRFDILVTMYSRSLDQMHKIIYRNEVTNESNAIYAIK